MLLKDFLREGTERLGSLYPAAEAKNILLMLCESRLGTRRYTHIVEPDYPVPDESFPILEHDLERLVAGEPIQYVLGYSEFCGRRFKVTPDVLIPRPETELLCEEAISCCRKLGSPARVLDLCTGSGCIAWTIALGVPGAKVSGIDISEKALTVASGQDFSSETGSSDAVAPMFKVCDVLGDEIPFAPESFDLVLSNPPYIMESQKDEMRINVVGFEPHLALFVPDTDPLVFYRAVARWSQFLLAPGGKGIVEINDKLGPDTHRMFESSGFEDVRTIKDYSDKNRFVIFSKPAL